MWWRQEDTLPLPSLSPNALFGFCFPSPLSSSEATCRGKMIALEATVILMVLRNFLKCSTAGFYSHAQNQTDHQFCNQKRNFPTGQTGKQHFLFCFVFAFFCGKEHTCLRRIKKILYPNNFPAGYSGLVLTIPLSFPLFPCAYCGSLLLFPLVWPWILHCFGAPKELEVNVLVEPFGQTVAW